MKYRLLLFSLMTSLGLVLLLPVQPVLAAPPPDDEVIFGDDLVLREGERIDGDLVVIGGDLEMRAESSVTGSVTVLAGEADVNGTVGRDLVALGGPLSLGPQAQILGDTVALGGRLERATGAQTGDVVQGAPLRNFHFWRDLRLPLFPLDGGAAPRAGLSNVVVTLVTAAGLALLAMAVISFWPTQTDRVADTIVASPLPSLGLGCLIYPLAASLVFFVLITICLAPLAPAVVLILVAAGLLGWVALGTLWGRQLARWTNWRRATRVAVTGVGVFTLTILVALLGAIPCMGIILILGGASIGLGAVALSRFGTSRYPAPVAAPPPES